MSMRNTRRRFIWQILSLTGVIAVPSLLAACRESGTQAVEKSTDPDSSDKESEGLRAAAETTTASSKMSKADANYQQQPNGSEKCSGCQFFIAGSRSCKVVEGQISPDGWCKLWVGKAG